jgi:triphosphatase
MRPATKNKSAQGDVLLGGRPSPGAARAVHVHLKKSTRNAAAFQIIANSCLHQVLENVPGISRGDSEAVHQMRVGLRRLRTVIAIFDGMVADKQRDSIKYELKWAAGALRQARDLDVLIGDIDTRPDNDRAASDLVELQKVLARRREAIYRETNQVIVSRRFRTLLLDVAGWIDTGDWLKMPNKTMRKLRDRRARRFAAHEISRRRKKILRAGRRLDRLGAVRRHKLRIAGKKLRYAAEFFAGLFPGKSDAKRINGMIHSLKDFQDALGTLNDIESRKEFTREISQSAGGGNGPTGAAVAAKRALGSERATAANLLRVAEAARARLQKAKPL